MGASAKKSSINKGTRVKSSVKKSESVSSSKASGCGLSPMMPKHYSARERQEIRKKELQILKGITN
jgi:hypothetical protein